MFLVEVIFRLVTKMPLWDWAMLRIFFSINVISLLLAIIFSFLGRIGGNIAVAILSLATTIYAIAQAGFENYLGTFMSLGTSSQAGAVKDYIKDYLNSFKWTYYLIVIPFVLLIIYYIFLERMIGNALANEKVSFVDKIYGKEAKTKETKATKIQKRKDLWIARIFFLFLISIFGYGFYYSLTAKFMQNELQLRTTKELFNLPDLPNVAVGQFGITTYGLIDVKMIVFPNAENNEYGSYKKKEQVISDYTRYIDDTAWEKLIADTTNYNYKTLNNYYISQEITPKNNYTGMFEGKNLIVILMESVNDIVINKEYFPNFYKLYSEGWAWTNSYSPRNACSTGNNEMSGMVSLYTIKSSCTANNYRNNVYPESMFNLFNNKGYNTSSYHDYTDQYYYRHTYHPNMGSGAYYGATDLGIPVNGAYKEWPSDVDLMQKSMDIYLHNDQFMVWLDTVSPHQPYAYSCTLCNLYFDDFADSGYSDMVNRYLSKLKVFDNALGTLIEGLKNAGKLDNTVIVMYTDHYPYGLRTSDIDKVLDYDVTENNEIDRTPFVIYNSTLTPTKYDEFTSYMNILPTLANLFNLDYDPRLYAGDDLLDENYSNRVVYANGSWRDDVAFYNATTGKISYYGDKVYTSEEIQEINKTISTKIKMSNLAITSDYFDYLDTNLKKYKEELAASNSQAIVPETDPTIENAEPTVEGTNPTIEGNEQVPVE